MRTHARAHTHTHIYISTRFGIKLPTMVDMPYNITKPNLTIDIHNLIHIKLYLSVDYSNHLYNRI